MRKLIYSMGVSLDGFIAGPDGEIDWSAPDEELRRFRDTTFGSRVVYVRYMRVEDGPVGLLLACVRDRIGHKGITPVGESG
jgi:hypothetical protein